MKINSKHANELSELVNLYGLNHIIIHLKNKSAEYKACFKCKKSLHESKYYVRNCGNLSSYCIKCHKIKE